MKRRLTRALGAPILLLLSAALLSGCFDVQTSYVVNEDGSGSQTLRLTVPPEVATSFGEELPDIQEMEEEPELEELRNALDEDESITFFSNEDEGFGFEMVLTIEPSDNFGAALEARGEELAAMMPDDEAGAMFQIAGNPPTIVRDGDEWVFEQAGAPLDPALLGDLSGGETGGPEGAAFAAMFLEQTTITTRVNLPGEVTEHNADEVLDDGTLVWHQTGADDERTLMARSELGGGGLSTMAQVLLLIGGITLVLLVAGFFLFGRSRRSA